MAARKKKKPYAERNDRERVNSNWTKTCGLFERGEYSVAVVRAATTAELMVNLAIRKELVIDRSLSRKFVDTLLLNANGIRGKFDKLLLPILNGSDAADAVRALSPQLGRINAHRNQVAHSGEFRGKKVARSVLEDTSEFIETLATLYDDAVAAPLPDES